MKNGEWLEDLMDWLEAYPWQWFVTLTSRPGLSEAQARWRLLRWAEELQENLGTKTFHWVGVPENGVTGLHFHYHLLVAGLKPGCGATERLSWMRRWWKLAGDAQIEDFRAGSGGVRYILKSVGPNDFDKIEFHLATRASIQTESGQKFFAGGQTNHEHE
jgi:hypothetical protein